MKVVVQHVEKLEPQLFPTVSHFYSRGLGPVPPSKEKQKQTHPIDIVYISISRYVIHI